MKTEWSEQFQRTSIMPDEEATVEEIITAALDHDALYGDDEYVVTFRRNVGPELWTEDAIRRTVQQRDKRKEPTP